MYQDTYFVPKRTGTYADVLTAYGLATLIDRIFQYAQGPQGHWRIEIADDGSHYLIRLSERLREEWVNKCPFFHSPAPFIVSRRTASEKVKRSALWEQGARGTDLEQQLRDMEPPTDWAVVAFVGDGLMQAVGIYDRIVNQWAESRPYFLTHVQAILSLYGSPSVDAENVLEGWTKDVKKAKVRTRETASQLLNPHQGKGQNESKANTLRMDNIKDRPWLEEFLKAVGLWACLTPRRVVDVQDWKAYVLAPLRLSWKGHQEAFRRFNRYLWNERRRDETSLKTDITSLLLFSKAWLDYVEAAQRDELGFDADLTMAVPEKVVAGFHVAQFKKLSRNAYTMVNLSFLNLPAWSGQPQDRTEVLKLKEVIDEHLNVIRDVDETRSDSFDLLRRYRDFVAGDKWDALFDFCAGYSHEILRRMKEDARWVPTFTIPLLRRLIMASNKPLLPIVESEGFQNVAYAIRYSTIIPQGRRARDEQSLYEVRYGLGAEFKRKATVRDEFVVALSNFEQSYNQENAQVLENTKQQMRRDLRTSDIQEVVRLVDEYGSEVVANLLIAFGYAREPREDVESKSN